MKILRVVSLAVVGVVLAWGTSSAEAQHLKIQFGNSGHHGNSNHHSGNHNSHNNNHHNSNNHNSNHNSGNNNHNNNHGNHNSHRGTIHIGNQHVTPGHHVDHHNHAIRDSHGQVIGNYHHDVIHKNSTYIVPHSGQQHHGTYHFHSGRYYYTPRTVIVTGRPVIRTQPTAVAFGTFSHVDDLAQRLELLANELCLDMHYNYSHNPGFQETYGEAYQVLQVSQFIHAAEHQHDRAAIQGRLGGLDRLFHHVEDDVRGWSRHQHKQVGQLGILSKMELIESTLHHLMNDVGVRPTAVGGVEPAPAPGGVEQAPVPTAAPVKL